MPRGAVVSGDILNYVSKSDSIVSLAELEEAFEGAGRTTIQRAMNEAVNAGVVRLITRGQAWEYIPAGSRNGVSTGALRVASEKVTSTRKAVEANASTKPEPVAGDVWEVIGRTSKSVLLRDGSGDVWDARRL